MTHSVESGAGGWHGVTIDGDLGTCWLCRGAVTPPALFCDRCGAIQPWSNPDPFALFGVQRRFDLDPEALNRQHTVLLRLLAPERFAVKSAKERVLAESHLETLDAAYATLRNPIARARCLLSLLGTPAEPAPALSESGAEPPARPDLTFDDGRQPFDLEAMALAVARAIDAGTLDRLANRMVSEIEASIHTLSAAFRAGRLGEAGAALIRLEQLETVSARARTRRSLLRPNAPRASDPPDPRPTQS